MKAEVTTPDGSMVRQAESYALHSRRYWGQIARTVERGTASYFAMGLALILIFTWKYFTVPRFAYWGYEWIPDVSCVGLGLVLVTLVAWFLPTRLNAPGDIVLHVMFYVMYVPAIIIPPLSLRMLMRDILSLQAILTICMMLLIGSNFLPGFRFDFRFFSTRTYGWFLLLVFVAMFLPIVAFVGVPTSVPSFADVYVFRARADAAIAASPFFVAYFWGFLTSVVNPYLVTYGLVTRRWLLVAAGAVGIVYIYAMSGAKSVLFALVLILAVMLGMRILGPKTVLAFGPGLWLMALMAKFVDLFIPVPWATTLLVDRALVTPGALTGRYFEYFSANDKVHWSHTFLSPFSHSGNAVDPSFTIGVTYYNESTQANTHMLADGFANFGYLGMVFVALVGGLLIWIYNSASLGRSRYLVIPVAATSGYTLASASVFTSLLTHGVALMLILVLLSPIDEDRGDSPNGNSQ